MITGSKNWTQRLTLTSRLALQRGTYIDIGRSFNQIGTQNLWPPYFYDESLDLNGLYLSIRTIPKECCYRGGKESTISPEEQRFEQLQFLLNFQLLHSLKPIQAHYIE